MRPGARLPTRSRGARGWKCGGAERPRPALPTSPGRRASRREHASPRAALIRLLGSATGGRRDGRTDPLNRGDQRPAFLLRPRGAQPSRPGGRTALRVRSSPARYRPRGSSGPGPGAPCTRREENPNARRRCRRSPVRAGDDPSKTPGRRVLPWGLLVFRGLLLLLTFPSRAPVCVSVCATSPQAQNTLPRDEEGASQVR